MAYNPSPRATRLDRLTNAVGTMRRKDIVNAGNPLPASGKLHLTYFWADKTLAVATVKVRTGSIAAAATPTLCRMGLYLADANDDLTLVAACANDTALFAATVTEYSRTLTKVGGGSYTILDNYRYAYGKLVVTAGALPSFYGTANVGAEQSIAPRESGALAGQTDLPSSISAGSVTDGGYSFFARFAA